jgi:hypothetical protein
MTDIRIDISEMVGTIAAVVMEPYTNFIVRLHTEGRVTAAEIEELHRAFLDAIEVD